METAVQPASKSVAIVGAGPSGLVMAKTLLHDYPQQTFRVRIFEQSNRVGGLWPLEAQAQGGLMNPLMRTNLCRFTVCFSDLSWNLAGIPPVDGHGVDGTAADAAAPLYPQAWQVGQYLQCYCDKYIQPDTISFNSQVTKAARIQSDQSDKWEVTTAQGPTKAVHRDTFDYLVVAAGSFTRSESLACELEGLEAQQTAAPVIHSSQYRGLSDLFPNGAPPPAARVAVLGGSHSGGEIATSIALDAASRYGINKDEDRAPKVVHITPHPMYALPSFTQLESDKVSFAPLDLSLYELSSRTEDTIKFMLGKMDKDSDEKMRDQIAVLIWGADPPNDVVNGVPEEAKRSGIPYAIVNDNYLEFVRAGAIIPKLGRAGKLAVQPNRLLSLQTSPTEKVDDLAAIVDATGFETTKSLDFLEEDTKQQLGFDSQLPRLPFKLDSDFITTSHKLPSFALIGFGGGPYWGILEMQARKAAERFTKLANAGSNRYQPSVIDGFADGVEAIRNALRSGMSVSQNILGDYVGFMEQAARDMSLRRQDLAWRPREGMVSPARYGGSDEQSKEMIGEVQQLKMDALGTLRFVSRAAFRSLHGAWQLQATSITDREEKPRSPGAPVLMTFYPRRSNSGDWDYEYVCLVTDGAGKESGSVWRYCESADEITIWSADSADVYTVHSAEQSLQLQGCASDDKKQCVLVHLVPKGRGRAIFPLRDLKLTFRGANLTAISASETTTVYKRPGN